MRVLRFDAFTLDLSRYVVQRGNETLPLRAKPFDVLTYLVEHPGQVVSKQELFDALWAGQARSDGALVQCVSDIRYALDDGDHRIIKTVPKRGYLFAAEVFEIAHASIPIAPVEVPDATTPTTSPSAPSARTMRSLLSGRHRASFLLAGALVLAASAAAWGLWNRSATQRFPHSQADHYVLLARAVLDHEHSARANKDAFALFDKALGLDPNSVPALLGYARTMLVHVTDGWAPREEHAVRFNQAEAAIERAIKLEPAHARAYLLRGFLWRARGNPDRALAAFQHALALNPNYAWAHAELGRTKIDLGLAEEAINAIETAIRLDPREPRLFNWYYWAGMAAAHAGRSDSALQWFHKWREPNQLYDRFVSPWLAVTYADVGREDEGRALISAHLARVPTFTIATFSRDFPAANPTVARQRRRIADILRRLGVPEGKVHTGSL